MRIAFVSQSNPHDPRSYSGTTACMLAALKNAGLDVRTIGPLKTPWKLYFNLKHAFYKLLGKSYARERDPIILRAFAKQVKAQLGDAQLVFSPSSIPVAELDCAQPIVLWLDAVFPVMIGFYWKNLAAESIRKGAAMERRALKRCRLALFSSEWAARSAVRECDADPAKVRVLEYGANLIGDFEPTAEEGATIIARRPRGRCDLLFIGIEWERKGAAFAIDVARELNFLNLDTTLRMVGCTPPADVIIPDFVRMEGFIDRSKPEDQAHMRQLFAESHFLILPSRAEACAMVLAEACAFGVPCIATDVGGIPTAVRDGVNGILLSLDAPARRWAQQLQTALDDSAEYQRLCQGALGEYHARLNWRVAAGRVVPLIESLAAGDGL